MRISKKDREGTVHDLPIQLANIAEMDNINPTGTKQKNEYKKVFELYKLFPKDADDKKKKEIISKIKVMNFNEIEIINENKILGFIHKFNRIVDNKRIELEDEIRAGRNVKKNDLILKNIEKVEVDIPRNIRVFLRIHEKAIRLKKFSTIATKNRIKYHSGQNYSFLIKDNFSKPYYIDYNKAQKIRREGNIIELLLIRMKESILYYYEKDKKELSQSNKKKWLMKKKIYDKLLNEVLEHNLNIATNKKYNKKFIKRDKFGNISKEDSEVPILMKIFDEIIDLYIP